MDENTTIKPRDPRGRKPNPNFGQEYVEPGDNSKYIQHAMVTLKLPPIDTKDEKQVAERIDWYFNHCASNDMKPTVKGLCNALGVKSRNTLREWYHGNRRSDTHTEIIRRAYDLLEELWENYMLNGKVNPVSGIFLGKNNFGYQDKQDIVVTPNTNNFETLDADTIAAKYAELPEEIEDV